MRRTLLSATAALIALAGLGLPAPARGAGLLDTYQRLAARHLSPAPLVPTTAPQILAPLARTIDISSTQGGRGYSVRLARYSGSGPDAIIVVTGGEFRTLRAALRAHRRFGFRSRRRMRIRGHRGYVLTRRLGPVNRSLVWVERGVVYEVGSGTPKKISLAHLRATARGLDRLERDWLGTSNDPDSSSEAFAVTTARTISIDVSFQASCTLPGYPEPSARVGQTSVTLLRRSGNEFAFDLAGHPKGEGSWSGNVTGTISAEAITLNLHATGTADGYTCDSGPQTLTLDQRLSNE
jgi:hypothetical protein